MRMGTKWLRLALVLIAIAVVGALAVSGASRAGLGPGRMSAVEPAQPQPTERLPLKGKPYLREQYFRGQRLGPGAELPAGALQRAYAERDARIRSGAIASAPQGITAGAGISEGSWVAIGPRPIGSGGSGWSEGVLPNSGRVTAVVAVDANTAYIGAASGGVWKTTDAGSTWTPLTDDQPSLAIGALALDPNNSSVIYAGLGEQNYSDSYYGFGVLKSVNAGATWTLSSPTIFSRRSIGRIAVDPNNSNVVYAAISSGIAKSTDAGATWTQACMAATCSVVTDVVIDASTNPSTVYAAIGNIWGSADNGVWRSTTDSDTWTKVGSSGASPFPVSDVGRIRLAITRTNPATIYAVIHRVSDAGILGVYRTSDAGGTWVATAHPETSSGASGYSVCGQCWYDLNIAVYPSDANVVYVLAVELFKSTDGGTSWSLVSKGYTGPPYQIHVDQHGFTFIPGNPNGFYIGNDGGIYRSLDAGATFENKNADLSITQVWRGAVHSTLTTSALAGTQDNGTLSYDNALSWYRSVGGDGGYAAIDFDNPTTVYASAQNLAIYRSTTGARGDYSAASTGIAKAAEEERQFIAPIVMDPNNAQVLYAGTTRVYRSTDGADSWSAVSPVLSSAPSTGQNAISAIAPAPSASGTIYAGTGSSAKGIAKLWVTTDSGANWTDRTSGLPDRFITGIAVHPTSSLVAYVVVSGFDTGHVWKTVNGGADWTNVSGALPNAPINAVVVDAATGQLVYVGTDVGVYKSADGGATWAALTVGMPNVVVTDLVLNRAGTRLYAFTHGRGVYVADRSGGTPTPTPTSTPTPTATPWIHVSQAFVGSLIVSDVPQATPTPTPEPATAQ